MIQRVLGRMRRNFLLWKNVFNSKRSAAFKSNVTGDAISLVDKLKRDGICVCASDTLFDENGCELLDRLVVDVDQKIQEIGIEKAYEQNRSLSRRKDFRFHFFSDEDLNTQHPIIQIALQPQLLEVVNTYMGMYARLHHAEVWLDFPTPDAPKETQLWHKDNDDFKNLKVFIYLNDVGERTGPFCFVPGTQQRGPVQEAATAHDGRVVDDDMAQLVSKESWKICVGNKKTVVITDTTGYHKGLKPLEGFRCMLMMHFTSGTPNTPRNLHMKTFDPSGLSKSQAFALSE